MSKPYEITGKESVGDLLCELRNELIGVSSSLHMGFETLPESDNEDFLADKYVFAKHAVEHGRAAFGIAVTLEQKLRGMGL